MKYDTDYFIPINNTKNARNCQDMNNNNIRKIAQTAILTALFVIFGKFLTLDFGSLKITLKNLPLYVGAISLGTLPGALIGCLGELTIQLTGKYGFSATTLLWILPHTIVGAICGFAFEKEYIKLNGEIKYWVFIICLQLLLTILNTIVMIIDSLIFGYYNPITLISSFVTRIMLAILVGIIYCIVIKYIVYAIKKIH